MSSYKTITIKNLEDIDRIESEPCFEPCELDISTDVVISLLHKLHPISPLIKMITVFCIMHDSLYDLPKIFSPERLLIHPFKDRTTPGIESRYHRLFNMIPDFKTLSILEICFSPDHEYSITDFLVIGDNHKVLDNITSLIITYAKNIDYDYVVRQSSIHINQIYTILRLIQNKPNIHTITFNYVPVDDVRIIEELTNNPNLKHIVFESICKIKPHNTLVSWMFRQLETLDISKLSIRLENYETTFTNLKVLKVHKLSYIYNHLKHGCFPNLTTLHINETFDAFDTSRGLIKLVDNLQNLEDLFINVRVLSETVSVFNILNSLPRLKQVYICEGFMPLRKIHMNLINKHPNIHNMFIGNCIDHVHYVNIKRELIPPKFSYHDDTKSLRLHNIGNSAKLVVDVIEHYSIRSQRHLELCFYICDEYLYSSTHIEKIINEIDMRPSLENHSFIVKIQGGNGLYSTHDDMDIIFAPIVKWKKINTLIFFEIDWKDRYYVLIHDFIETTSGTKNSLKMVWCSLTDDIIDKLTYFLSSGKYILDTLVLQTSKISNTLLNVLRVNKYIVIASEINIDGAYTNKFIKYLSFCVDYNRINTKYYSQSCSSIIGLLNNRHDCALESISLYNISINSELINPAQFVREFRVGYIYTDRIHNAICRCIESGISSIIVDGCMDFFSCHVKEILDKIKYYKHVEKLTLTCASCTGEIIDSIIDIISDGTNKLTKLNLNRSIITVDGQCRILEAMKLNNRIRTLKIDYYSFKVSKRLQTAVINLLETNRTLKRLYVFNNSPFEVYSGIEEISNAIIRNRTIIKLDLDIESIKKLLYFNKMGYNNTGNILSNELGISADMMYKIYNPPIPIPIPIPRPMIIEYEEEDSNIKRKLDDDNTIVPYYYQPIKMTKYQ